MEMAAGTLCHVSCEHKVTRGGDAGSRVPAIINAAPCFPHKVSISPLMHLPLKVTEPGLAHY